MKVKKVKVLMAAILVLVSALSVNFYAFATEEGDDSDFVINEITTEEPTEEKTTSEPTTRPTTTKPTTTRKPTTTSSYRPVYTTSAPTTQATEGFTIKLELNNGEEALEIAVDDNGIVEVPEAPEKEGFKFDGWYSDEALTERWDFITSKATEDTILYAKWASLQDETLFTITVSTNLGGVVTVEPEKAQAGEIVTITVMELRISLIFEFAFRRPRNMLVAANATEHPIAMNNISRQSTISLLPIHSNRKMQGTVTRMVLIITFKRNLVKLRKCFFIVVC